MKRIILALAMLTMLAVMALPAMAQSGGGDDYNRGNDYNQGGYDRGNDYDRDNDYDQGGYDNWGNWFYNQDSCDWYWSISGPQYWCWSPFSGWNQLW